MTQGIAKEWHAALTKEPWHSHPIPEKRGALKTQEIPNQKIEQLIPVDFADQTPCVLIVGDIGGILRQDVAHDLVDGIVALFLQSVVHRLQDRLCFRLLFMGDGKGDRFSVF